MQRPIIRLEEFLRKFMLSLDYFLYLLFNPFKFKKFPKVIKNILVIELMYIGDLIVATPSFRAIKERFSNAKITLLLYSSMKDVINSNPNIDGFITIDEIKFFDMVKRLKQNNFDLAIILHPGSFKISLALLFGNVKFRIGCTRSGIIEGKGFFLN